ncbi:MAG TPA: TraI domain-containing protein, partial [Coxiellaceae bacterium]|nr:TraI domain-containing protein [Coxiellaceae bacterium]
MFIKNPTDGLIPKKPSDNRKAKLRSHSYKAGHRLPVLSASELLSSKKRRWTLEQVAQLSYLEEDYYQVTYAELITNFAEFVQVVPMHATAYLGSLLNESLALGFSSLHHHLRQNNGQAIKKTAPDPLLCFAVFSAGLLVNVARMAANQRIVLTAEDGSFLKTWNPMAGPLKEFGKFYKLRFINDGYAGVHYALT